MGPRRRRWDGRTSQPWWEFEDIWVADLLATLARCKSLVVDEIARIIPDREPKRELYDLIRDYPAREGKELRPTLVIATCCAFGGRVVDAVRAAAALELFHNGLLIHDDIADESTQRRGLPTLSIKHGAGLAVNSGDGLNLLAVDTVLSNMDTLGLARTLGLIHQVLHMCRETIEGRAVELGWDRLARRAQSRRGLLLHEYEEDVLVHLCQPCRIGAVCAGETDPRVLGRFDEAFRLIGIAFQIQDDVSTWSAIRRCMARSRWATFSRASARSC
jgi:geranylgeranyl diphosphate synthase, type II